MFYANNKLEVQELRLRPSIHLSAHLVCQSCLSVCCLIVQVIGILLNVREEAEIQLLVSYVVSNASWTPRYDLRVSSSERTMQVTYFGMVQQNTGEDWCGGERVCV